MLISVLEKINWFGQPSNAGAIVENGWVSFWGKSAFKMLGLFFSSNFNWSFYIDCIDKIASKKIEASIGSYSWGYSLSL